MENYFFQEAYNRDTFLNFLRTDFLPDDFEQIEQQVEFATKTVYSKSAVKLGVCKSLDLVVYEITHTGKEDPRVGLSKEAFRMLAEEWQDRALVIFVADGKPQNYRFSLIEIKLEGKENSSRIERKYSNPRRYSYLLGEGIGGRTPDEYLVKKGKVRERKEGTKTLFAWDDMLSRFSVEILTKQFYTELSNWYAWAIDKVEFPGEQSVESGDKRIEHRSKNVIRLLTRLLFVWFLKQKKLIPWQLFDEEYLSENILKDFNPNLKIGLFAEKSQTSKYYKAILQNLFFATLNCPITPQSAEDKRERGFRKSDWYGQGFGSDHLMRYENLFSNPEAFLSLVNERVPFLNGGLFDCLDDKQNKVYIDGFSDNLIKPNILKVPDYLFFGENEGKGKDLSGYFNDKKKKSVDVLGLLDILKNYNFTIEENTPFDQEVSLDPELLGKVFENLLASYNPETKTTARKQTGSFYTPREIVQYMVDESLVAHLKRTVGDELEEEYRKLMQYTDEELNLSDEQRRSIIQSLQNCKVLDPACGSGAFPVGVLQQMVHILSQLDPTNDIWKKIILNEHIAELGTTLKDCNDEERKEMQNDINLSFDDSLNRPDYARKLYLIENCIYGVDIQSIAVQISKLRFFISLVVDQKPNSNAYDNFGIRPLPNLEAKFVAANTLIGLSKGERNFFDNDIEIERLQEKLKQTCHRIFGAKNNKRKNSLKEKVGELQTRISERLSDLGVIPLHDAKLLQEWKMFDQNASSPFFDSEWMFGVSGGFDIVIGNPPYVQLQANGGLLAEQLKDANYKTFARTGDIYCLFYERGLQLLCSGGIETYITSNKWMRAGYGEKIRAFFAKNNPLRLLDLGAGIFESATVDTNILIIQKGANRDELQGATLNDKSRDFGTIEFGKMSVSDGDIWTILSPLEQSIKRKIESIGTPLKDWDVEINYGIKTGYNEAFIIDTAKRDELVATDPRSAEIIKPILRGRDIKRYSAQWAGLWLIFIPWHFPLHKDPSVQGASVKAEKAFENEYPALYDHFLEHKEALSKRNKAETGIRYEWYALQRCAATYYEEFEKEKIVWASVGANEYSLIPAGILLLDTNYFMVCEQNNPLQTRVLISVMNSKLFINEIKNRDTALGTGGAYRHYKYNLEALSIPKLSEKEQLPFVELVDKILGAKKADPTADTSALENEIDFLVYKLYGLTYDELLTIDPQTLIKKDEYEKATYK